MHPLQLVFGLLYERLFLLFPFFPPFFSFVRGPVGGSMSGVSQIGGHGVSGPSLVTANLKWLVHSCAADTLAVCALKDGSSNSTSSPDSDFISTVELVMLPESEQLTVLHLHPTKDLLFVGAKPTGLYLTPVINAELGDDSELLPRSTGNALSATFIDGGEKGSDVLVVSCGHAEGTATEGNTLFIWNVQRRSLLWRGSTEAMISMSPVPGTTGFASCSRKNVFLWNIRRGEGGGYTGGFSNAPVGDGTAKSEVGGDEVITVIRKKCATVKGLRDMEYVSVVPPAASPESSLVLLTAKGFLVSFDIQSGEALKWMDCKISDVATAYQIADDIVVCGNIIRFFSALTWEFRGKIKPSDYFSATNISFPLRFSNLVFKGAATCDKNALALFFSEGFMSRYRVVWPRCVTGRFQSTSVKLSLHRVYQYMPLFLENSPLFWLPLSHDVMCLWSPKKLQLYRVDSWFNTANIDFESNFVAYHRRLNVLVFYIHSTGSLLVLPRRLENAVFLKNMLCRVTVEEPLTTLIGIEANRFVGVSPGNILFYFEGRWDAIELDFHLRQVRATPFSGLTNPLKHLVWTAGVLCAASVRDVVNLHTGRCITLEYDIVGLLAGGDGVLLVIHSHACVFLGATSLKSVGTTILGAAFGGGTTSAEGKLAVVHSDRSVYVVDMVGARCVKHFKASQEAHAVEASTILSAGFTEDGSNIIICDSAGLLKLFKLGDLCTAPCITDGDGTSQDEVSAASFCGENSGFCMGRDEQPEGPTNNQLQTRLQDLNDFYEASRRASSSRRTDGQSNASARDVRRDDDRSSAEKPSEDSPASAHGGTGSIISPSPHEKDPLVSHQESVHSARCWKADEIPAKLPSVAVPVGSGKNDVGVSVSLVEVSALTSVESRQNDFSACTMPEGDAGAVSRSMCDISPNNREEAVGTDVPAYVMRSPTRKGELSMSPNKNPEDDVVNVDSVDGADARQSVHGFRRPADYHDVANDFPIERGTMNTSSSSIRMKSLEIRKGLRELADAYERQGEENEDTVDEETVDELFSIVSRLYTKLQARQNRRSNSSVSITSDLSTASMNAMLAGIHCLQCQNNRIEAQNRDILSRLSSVSDR
uniref:Guanine nucleotide-binding protein subunit beta-like protein n=1 Tax=Trypanosoma congolense (strain IL3000) TaxID=1068625 RepID=G0UZV0_TRYCI|nr:conserved hypothetical protein [Trypanosoma congolense IL3000]